MAASEHSRVAPHKSGVWINCTKSVEMESRIPQEDTQYTTEGTLAHAVCESILKKTEIPECNNEMLGYCEGYAEYCTEQTNRINKNRAYRPVVYVEEKLDLSSYIPEGFGTADYIAVSGNTLVVIDFKYGKGVAVSADYNVQLMIYALGALEMLDFLFDIEKVEMHIYQPRIGNIDVFMLPVNELREIGETIKIQAEKAFKGEGECEAGTHCVKGFCRARGVCRAFAEYNLELEKYEAKKAGLIADSEFAEILSRAEALENWVKSIKDYALARALSGEKIAGMKLVKGKGRRVIADESKAIEILKNAGFAECTATKLKGITELEKYVGKKKFSELVSSLIELKEGSPTLVPESDKREEYVINSAELDFADVPF